MNIALVILHADPARGGAERYTFDLAKRLTQRGHRASVLASSFADLPGGVTAKVMRSAGATRTARYIGFLNSVDDQIGSGRYDIVHAMLPVRHCDVYHPHAGIAVHSTRQGHTKNSGGFTRAISRLGNSFNRRRQQFTQIETALLTGANPPVVLCLSEKIKSTVERYYPSLPAERLVILFNSTDLDRFDPRTARVFREPQRERFGYQPDQIVGLMVAQDFERKGLRQAIDALAMTADPRLRLLIVGKQDPKCFQKLAIAKGVADRIHFAGPTQDPIPFYAAADFFVLPTRADPCSLVVLESLAMGLPVISTAANGACEIMTDGVHGRVLESPDDIPALNSAMVSMLDADRRLGMSNACLSLRMKLSYDQHLSLLEAAYQRVQH